MEASRATSPRVELGPEEPALAAGRVLRERHLTRRGQLVQGVRCEPEVLGRLAGRQPPIAVSPAESVCERFHEPRTETLDQPLERRVVERVDQGKPEIA